MKSKMLSVIAIAAGLSLAAAGTASASPLGHLNKHKPAQVTGVRLLSALLPPSDFGDGFYTIYTLSTGNKLWSSHSRARVSSTSCTKFEAFSLTPAFGKTAQAQEGFNNPTPLLNYPFTVGLGVQYVNQFVSTRAAATFYSQAFAKYKACKSFTEPNPGDPALNGGTMDVSTMSVSNTTVGKYRAFQVTQQAAYSEATGFFFWVNTLFVVAGTNVYELYEDSGTNDEPSPTLMKQLINRVQKLY